ncbi:trypsin-like peptidase [Kribbella amoyensis]|uniref:Trypsin-like peptidase n=1 Tax=Kribbella amoyensis TaxID=996641 RepID=A0A561B8U8_9ACTN|nr:serine protease [Kribbella amoyensis]TWD75385.1 trypsin-like peptidase [Kribbella amoyensis]
MGDGRRELPRPPRRIPSGPQTTIEPRRPVSPEPLPPKLRFRFLVPLVVFVLVLGAGAGWLVREQSLGLDTEKVLGLAGPSVVRVLATTCDGTGQASGVLLPGGLVLTAASAIRTPVSVALLTDNGRVRQANVLGVTRDGIGVLRVRGRLEFPTATIAEGPPRDAAERAFVAYDGDGDQVIRQAGTANRPRALTDILDDGALGAPLVDHDGDVIGLLAGETVATGKVIGLTELRGYAGPDAAITPEPTGGCQFARGPQHAAEPDLAVANTPLAGEVRATLGEYLDTLNRHDFDAMQDTYSERLKDRGDAKVDARKHGTSYAFGAVITEVTAGDGGDAADARMSFTVLFSPNSAGARGQTCSRLDIRYHLVREQQRLRIDSTATLTGSPGCDTD